MRVLHVNASLDPVLGGGTAERTVGLCRALLSLGVTPSVLTLDMGLDAHVRTRLRGVRVEALRCVDSRFYVPRPDLRRVHAAVDRADVVHLSGHWTVLNALAYAAARVAGKPHVVNPAGALPVFGRSAHLKRGYNVTIGTRIVCRAAAHVAITPAEVESFVAYGVPPGGVHVIPNGVSLEDFADPGPQARAELARRLGGDRRPFLLFMGRLNPIKGPDLLLAAAGQLRRDELGDLHIVYAGPDEGMGKVLARQALSQGLTDRVVFLGPVQGGVKVAAYRGARLLVVPSRREAMSIVAVEAGASGVPVLVTDACGFPEVEQAGGGRVVPATVDGLADGLRGLLARPRLLPVLGEHLQELVRTRYSWDRAARSYVELYRRLLTSSESNA